MKRFIYLVATLLVMVGAVSCKDNSSVREPEDMQSTGEMRSATITDEGRPACQSALDDDSNWVEIGGRYWLKENTKCVEYDTESEAYNADWLAASNTIPTSESRAYTPYYTAIPVSQKPSYMSEEQFSKLGMLYNWAAAVGVEGSDTQMTVFTGNRQGICPNGSHIPSVGEWIDLADALRGNTVAGKKLKSVSGWNGKSNGTDEYGFAALPAGGADGCEVAAVGDVTVFWTATLSESNGIYSAYSCGLIADGYESLHIAPGEDSYGQSVRCIRDYSEELNTPAARPACQRALDDDRNWVKIGSQYWLKENTKCIEYDTESEAYNATWLTNNAIPTSSSAVDTPYYTASATDSYGYYYNWAAAVGVETEQTYGTEPFSDDRQGICPNGSHIPTTDEWDALKTFIETTDGKGEDTAGKHLKSTSGWFSSWYINGNGKDTYGFAALPAGYAHGSSVSLVGSGTGFWAATPRESCSNYAYYRDLSYGNDSLYVSYLNKNYGQSVRCLRN